MSLSKGRPAIASHDPQTGRQHDREERHAVLTGSGEHVPRCQGCIPRSRTIPEEGKWVQAKEISDISGLTHGVGWCAPQQGACKLTLNVKDGIIEEALVETIGCSGMTTLPPWLPRSFPARPSSRPSTPTSLRRHQRCYARDLPADRLRPQPDRVLRGRPARGRSLDDLGKGLRSQVGTMFGTKAKGARYLELAQATSPAWLSTTRTRSSRSSS